MKKEIVPSILLTIVCLVFFCVIYPAIIWAIAQVSRNRGEGFIVSANGKNYYENIGQKFTVDSFFWSRPSAVDYNAAGSGGSNKGPANPEYLKQVQDRIDTFMVHNPAIKKSDIPIDMITASGSGLDPDISIQAALVQVPRIAKAKGISETELKTMINKHVQHPLWGVLGPEKVNVLKLNLDLCSLQGVSKK